MHVCVKMMSKGLKEALTVLIVTHVTQVKRVKSGVCGSYTTPYAVAGVPTDPHSPESNSSYLAQI